MPVKKFSKFLEGRKNANFFLKICLAKVLFVKFKTAIESHHGMDSVLFSLEI